MKVHFINCFKICALTIIFPFVVKAQIPAWSVDFGASGFYNSSPLTISRGGNAINGLSRDLSVNGALGLFVFENASVGLRYNIANDYLEVESQFFNASLGQYEPYIQIEQTNLFGLYGRYYTDLSQYFAAFAHVEVGTGTSLLSVTEENDQGEIIQSEYPRDLEDFGIALGLAIRPTPIVGIEFSALRRTQFESYIPSGTTTNIPQIETRLGFEFRIGLRINVNFRELRSNANKDRMPVGPRF
ncbi:MAG: hypothetical protein JXQ87_17745 [Bacteroidia bacterium]